MADPISEMKSNSSEGVVDISPVTQWLQSLGLSKYKDIFVKEEINWETLQCLTEEVRDVYSLEFLLSIVCIFLPSCLYF